MEKSFDVENLKTKYFGNKNGKKKEGNCIVLFPNGKFILSPHEKC